MSVEMLVILMLSVALAVFGAVTVGSWYLTRKHQDALRRSSHLTTVCEGKLHEAQARIRVQRDEIERLTVERDSAKLEVAQHNLRVGSGG